jgi:Arc/MetJ family transcription regulator
MYFVRMTRITVEIDDELLAAAREVLGTETKVATINAALQSVTRRKQVREAIELMNSVEMDYTRSVHSFKHGGGRDLSRLEEKARLEEEEARLAEQTTRAEPA